MTAADIFGTSNKEVDPERAASALGDILGFFHGEAMGSNPISQGIGAQEITSQPGQPKEQTQPAQQASGDRASPVPEGTGVSQGYGVNGHPGIDFSVPLNTQLLAAATGTVTHAANDDPGGYGEWVEITTPDGFALRYGHLHSATVKVGDQVHAGQIIGTSGGEAGGPTSGNSTGAHLHFEVRSGGQSIDPTPFLAGGYQILGGTNTSDATTASTPDPQALAAVQLQNVVNVLGGKPPQDLTAPTTTTTDQQANQTGTTSTADNDPNAVEAFLAATRQHESGGNYTIYNQSGQSNASGAYQFLGSTWRGLGGSTQNAAEASPAEQDRIARNYAMQLFNQFHSWRLVAIAWYGGPGVAQQVANGQDPGAPQGQGGYLAYGDTIARMMQGGG